MISDCRITAEDVAAHGVVSSPDKLTGTAAENKAVFDALVREVVKEKLNALIGELLGEGCAAQLGFAPIPELPGCRNVQAAIERIVAQLGPNEGEGRKT